MKTIKAVSILFFLLLSIASTGFEIAAQEIDLVRPLEGEIPARVYRQTKSKQRLPQSEYREILRYSMPQLNQPENHGLSLGVRPENYELGSKDIVTIIQSELQRVRKDNPLNLDTHDWNQFRLNHRSETADLATTSNRLNQILDLFEENFMRQVDVNKSEHVRLEVLDTIARMERFPVFFGLLLQIEKIRELNSDWSVMRPELITLLVNDLKHINQNLEMLYRLAPDQVGRLINIFYSSLLTTGNQKFEDGLVKLLKLLRRKTEGDVRSFYLTHQGLIAQSNISKYLSAKVTAFLFLAAIMLDNPLVPDHFLLDFVARSGFAVGMLRVVQASSQYGLIRTLKKLDLFLNQSLRRFYASEQVPILIREGPLQNADKSFQSAQVNCRGVF